MSIDDLLNTLVDEYGAAVPDGRRGVGAAADVEVIPAPENLEPLLADRVNEEPVEQKRSEQHYGLIALALMFGHSDAEICALARSHKPSVQKWGHDEAHRQAEASLGKLRPDHDHEGQTCLEASCAHKPDWMKAKQPSPAETRTLVQRLAKVNLPDEFWTARPSLAHIREAARSRMLSPDAVLGAVLARVAMLVPHTVELPPIVASAAGLSYFSALVGPPESGKTASANAARELLPAPENALDGLPIGSGEGLVDILFNTVEEQGDDGKARKVKKQTRYAANFHIDEGSALTELAARRGSTLLPTLRSAWVGETIGNTNATVETRRIIPARNYVFGITLAIQPELAAPLLADAAAGTPQRFVWFSALDPDAPEHLSAWPGPLEWEPPTAGHIANMTAEPAPYGRQRLQVHPDIVTEIREERRAVTTGQLVRDSLDAHSGLARLKTAALLALLDDRADINGADWQLAHTVITTSQRVRASVSTAIANQEQQREQAATERHARRELHVEDSKERRALIAASRAIGNAVARHQERADHTDGGCPRRCLTQAISGKHRQVVTVDEAVAEAERNRWITPNGDRWTPGESRPA